MPLVTNVQVVLPAWVPELVDADRPYPTAEGRMELAIRLAEENVRRGSGGPFGAAVFEAETGRLVSAGVNLVVPLANSCLHAEMVAFMLAERRLGRFSLGGEGAPAHELVTSCEPCAMCRGAVLWSGVQRVTCGATREDAARLDFDEGPVFPESYRYLEARGVRVDFGVRRDAAVAVLERYRAGGGPIYNG